MKKQDSRDRLGVATVAVAALRPSCRFPPELTAQARLSARRPVPSARRPVTPLPRCRTVGALLSAVGSLFPRSPAGFAMAETRPFCTRVDADAVDTE